MKVLLDEKKIEETIRKIKGDRFTVLDFITKFKRLYPKDWRLLTDRFGRLGERRRYTAKTYLSNRLDWYSRKEYSLLKRFTTYMEDKRKDYRKATREERELFHSQWIAVFRKR